VEDDPDLAANLDDFLELRGHAVDFAATGPQGRALAAAHPFDALVLDRLLPGMTGRISAASSGRPDAAPRS